MDEQTEAICQLSGVCRYLGKHPAHCQAIAGDGRADAGLPCVRALGHPGDAHAYGMPRGVSTAEAALICGECLERWPGHLFECPQYQLHGTGAPPAPGPVPPWTGARRCPGAGRCGNCGHAAVHWIAAGQDICSAPTPCGCEHYDPKPPPGSAPTSAPPTSAPSSSSAPPSSAARSSLLEGLSLTRDEIALFNRYAEKWRGIGQRYGFDFGVDGSKIVAGVVLLLRIAYEPRPPAKPRPRPAFSTSFPRRRGSN